MGISIKRRKFSTRNLYDRRLLIYRTQTYDYQHVIRSNRKARKVGAKKTKICDVRGICHRDTEVQKIYCLISINFLCVSVPQWQKLRLKTFSTFSKKYLTLDRFI